MTTPEHPVIEALEHIASNWSKNPREDAAEVLPLARELVAAKGALDLIIKHTRKAYRYPHGDFVVISDIKFDDLPPILKEMIEKEK